MDKLSGSDLLFQSLLCFVLRNTVSSLNATDKTPMNENSLAFVFRVWGFGVWESIFVLGFYAMALWHWHFISRANFFFAHSNIGEQYSTIYICIAPFSECTVFRGFVTWFMIIRELECNQNSLIDISCPTATSPWLPKIVVDATHCLCISFEFVKAEKYHFSYSLLNLHDVFSLTAMSQVN